MVYVFGVRAYCAIAQVNSTIESVDFCAYTPIEVNIFSSFFPSPPPFLPSSFPSLFPPSLPPSLSFSPPLPHPESGSKCCSPFFLCPGAGKLMQLGLSLPYLLLQTRDCLLLPVGVRGVLRISMCVMKKTAPSILWRHPHLVHIHCTSQ